MNIPEEGENKLTDAKLQGYAAVLAIGSTRCKANMLGMRQNLNFLPTLAFDPRSQS